VLSIEIFELFFILFHHANIRVPNEDLISKIFITPSLHRTHHSKKRSEHDSNYGIVFSIWDQLFGTRKQVVPEHIGLDLIEADNFIQLFSLAFITEIKIKKLLSWIPKGKK
jgi:sterol desaturase/sphingolipid hydroxylase (fatty acid hydroxylase superfamily)